MLEFNYLILTSVTLLIVVVLFLFRSLWLKSTEVDRLKQILQGTVKKVMSATHVCPYQIGYLSSFPKGKPIPSECMGCSDIFECLAHKRKGRESGSRRAIIEEVV